MSSTAQTTDLAAADRNARTLRELLHAASIGATDRLGGAQCASTLEYVIHAARPVTDRRIAAINAVQR